MYDCHVECGLQSRYIAIVLRRTTKTILLARVGRRGRTIPAAAAVIINTILFEEVIGKKTQNEA